MADGHNLALAQDDFLDRARRMAEAVHNKLWEISDTATPEVDGLGRKIVEKRPDGHLYVNESYMRNRLDHHFPGWSWEMAAPVQFLGGEWVVVQGHLVIPVPELVDMGIIPPVRRFYGLAAKRVAYRTEVDQATKRKVSLPHTTENIIDMGNDVRAANSIALKHAINRLCRIADDIYGKRIEEEGAGTLAEWLEASGQDYFK